MQKTNYLNRWILGLVLTAAASFALSPEVSWSQEFEKIFNGRDLSGWSGDPELWSVEDGAITGKTKGPDHLDKNQFLIWDGGEVGDFELVMEFRLEGDNNSGVQYRSQRLKDQGEFIVGGYQADIHSNPPYTGMLYDERGRGILAQRGQKVIIDSAGKSTVTKLDVEVKPLDLTEWHTLKIEARGNRVRHSIDGKPTVEIVDMDPKQSEQTGIIALQVHRGPAMKIQFRSVQLKKLGDESASLDLPAPNWVWYPDNQNPAAKLFFRKEFTVKGEVKEASLVGTCDNVMRVFLDGQELLRHDEWSTPVMKDLTPQLAQESGERRHVLCIEAENQGTNNPAGLLVQLSLDKQRIVTDESWQVATRPRRGWKTLDFKANGWHAPKIVGALGGGPWTQINRKSLAAARHLKEATATDVDTLTVKEGFQVELLYSVPKSAEGSWVNMCATPDGHLIVSDQYGALYQVTPPPVGTKEALQVEPLEVELGEAQGLLWAFDSLYVMVNRGGKYESGLYRVRDTSGDGRLDSVEQLRKLDGGGEHGPHAILLSPDGKSLFVVCGNGTRMPEFQTSRVPRTWDEDQLLPRTYGRGFMKGVRAPGGFIARISPDGKDWELVATGFRNEFDAAFNADGELFTFDADMEWDLNTPWYRPTRVCHVISGADFGWRNGSGKWPAYYPDSLPATVDIGPGSPTGICFGYGSQFPAKYQRALFISDWSYGKLYAVHLQPQGASYTAQVEEFIAGTPLPLTDLIVNPHDGALYFLIGGRRVQSGLYRVTYRGDASTAPATATDLIGRGLRQTRQRLESLHLGDHLEAVDTAWPHLTNPDQFLRHAARVALEHRPREEWQTRVFETEDTQAALTGMLALTRTFTRANRGNPPEIDSTLPDWANLSPPPEHLTVLRQIRQRLAAMSWTELTASQKVEYLRILSLAFLRICPPDAALRAELIAELEERFPAQAWEVNSELAQLLVYLQSPSAASKIVEALAAASTQEQQIDLAKSLRHLKTGWTAPLRKKYFEWFNDASGFRGGASFGLFVQNIKDAAVQQLSDSDREALKEVLAAKPQRAPTTTLESRPIVKAWTMADLERLVAQGLSDRDYANGKKMFAAANCFACHRFDNQGGAVGPDLTSLAGRFSPKDILESVLEPSKVISDQYSAVTIVTLDGRVVTGRIVNLGGDNIQINTDMLDPNKQVGVNRNLIDEVFPSKTSMMPTGLLNTLKKDEVLDLMAYLLSRGDPTNAMFSQAGGR